MIRLLVFSTASGNKFPSKTIGSDTELGESSRGLQSACDTGNATTTASGLGPVDPTRSSPWFDRGGNAAPSELPAALAGEV